MNPNNLESKKQTWLTQQVMQQVYANRLWGSNNTLFYSGEGSHLEEIVKPYIKSLVNFLKTFSKPPVLCDLGCGDFNIGQQLVPYTSQYIGIDIVPELITYNKDTYQSKNIIFYCKDLSKDSLPVANCAILRQVLQHLSNTEIQSILNKLDQYQYVIITEHLPIGDFKPNIDIISGQGIRIKKKSGVVVQEAPFNFKLKMIIVLNTVILENGKGMIQTILYRRNTQ